MPSSQTMSYKYNSDGIRTQKTFTDNAVKYYYKHDYILDGANIVAETISYFTYFGTNTTETLYYYYDESGAPTGIKYNGNVYYFQKNLQGDIIRILNSSGSIVATYTYDAWGNIIASTDTSGVSIGTKNPFRYRGYYYDTETGLYYLNSRYYDPQVGRFLNADAVIAGITSDVKGYNMFAYCFNNPVNMADSTGHWPKWATIALGAVAAVAAVAITVATVGAAAPAAACTLTMIGMSLGVSYTAASTVATIAVVTTTVAASTYAGDLAYSTVTGDSILLNTVFNGNVDAYNSGLNIVNFATAGMFELAAQSPGVCFVAGTLIATASGENKIEEISVGTFVYATNVETGETQLKEVVNVFVNETNELIHIWVNGEEIICTNEHPFYSPIKGWIAAEDLKANDVLATLSGEHVTIEKTKKEILHSPVKVYNFEVEDFHTYYVGKTDILVHNKCFRNRLQDLTQMDDETIETMDAHHVFPRTFSEEFSAIGVDYNNEIYGSWMKDGIHRGLSYEYNDDWRSFLYAVADSLPTYAQTIEFGKMISQKYGFEIYFK